MNRLYRANTFVSPAATAVTVPSASIDATAGLLEKKRARDVTSRDVPSLNRAVTKAFPWPLVFLKTTLSFGSEMPTTSGTGPESSPAPASIHRRSVL